MAAAERPDHSRRLDQLRADGFVGRAAPLAAIAASIEGRSAHRVHLVHGPGGIGKTTLLDAADRQGRALHRPVLRLDGRDVVCSPAAIEAWYGTASGTGNAEPSLLLIDGYELLAPLDGWFRTIFLPSLPAESVTVLAGRTAPSEGWWLDAGWRVLATTHELDVLDRSESDLLLARLDVAPAQRAALAQLGRGHPLVLVMLAEAARRRTGLSGFEDAPDVVGRLCSMLVDDVPSPAHRLGLATCAHAAQTTQDLLQHTVGERSGEIWDWLSARSYVRHGAVGLFLHDVVRALFEAEFRHRSPDGYLALHRAVREYFEQRLDDPRETHPERAATEILLLHRRGPLSAEVGDLPAGMLPPVVRASPGDQGWMLDLLERADGVRAADIARGWFADHSATLYRLTVDGGPSAFAHHGYLSGPPEFDDPVATAIWNAVGRHGPLRPGERIDVNRFSAAGGGTRDPLLLLVNGTACVLEWRRQPAAWTFLVTPDPDYYADYFGYLGMRHLVSIDLGAGPVGAWGWDRRRLDVRGLFEMMSIRELTGEIGPPPAHLLRPAPLARAEFDRAVRAALGGLTRPDRLADSPLLGSALVHRPDPGELASALIAVIAGLADEPQGAEHRRVLERTHLHTAPSQEAAAALLGLPFSTYRRHLAQAVERLCEVLWAIELGTSGGPPVATGQKVGRNRPGE
ncbi:MAG: ATP-binding protein [Micropruina sp.]|nr:ATP-binding protein [Micropruina sp.]